MVLSLTTTGDAGFPVWMEALNGNSSDKTSFHNTIALVQEFQKQLQEAPNFIWIADSALYTIDKLLNYRCQLEILWITRVPSTVSDAKALCEMPSEMFEWQEIGNGYYMVPLGSNHGNLSPRWLLIYSQHAYERESQSFERQLLKTEEKLAKQLWHFSNQVFTTAAEAYKAFLNLVKRYPNHNLHSSLEEVYKYAGKGRPKTGQLPQMVGYRVSVSFCRRDTAIAKALNTKGRFILATNQLDEEQLSDLQIFQEYKKQSQVERGFRFLKDPMFMANSLFLKNPQRIEALMMVMTLCLMIYNVGEYQLRQQLKQNEDTLPNQVGKSVSNPTLRWVFQMMSGISVAQVFLDKQHTTTVTLVCNLDDLLPKIIRYFGSHALEIYGMT